MRHGSMIGYPPIRFTTKTHGWLSVIYARAYIKFGGSSVTGRSRRVGARFIRSTMHRDFGK